MDASTPRQHGSGRLVTAGGESARIRYGDHDSQWLELTVPRRVPAPVAVLVHGGFWKRTYGTEYSSPLVPSLLARGWATSVVEYRRVGDGGGYPATLDDVATAVDLLGDLGEVLDLSAVVAVGHSAGGQLAAWLAARATLPDGVPGAGPRVPLAAVVAQAGVLDLRQAARDRLGGGAVERFLGGTPEGAPDRYVVADPAEHLPLGVPVLCVHGTDDADVPPSQSTDFVRRAQQAGDAVELVEAPGDHFTVIDPDGPAWAATLRWLDRVAL